MQTQPEIAETLDRLQVMRLKEKNTYRCREYARMNHMILENTLDAVDETCRSQMCVWCFQIVECCSLNQETAMIALSNLDRFVSTLRGGYVLANRRAYQLAAMTSLYTAVKIHEETTIEASVFASLSQGTYSVMEFIEMEKVILEALEWRITGPTPLCFVRDLIALMPPCIDPSVATIIKDISRRQIELAVAEYTFIDCLPSEIALASILNAMSEVDIELLPLRDQEWFIFNIERNSGFVVANVRNTQMLLNRLYMGFSCNDDMVADTDVYSAVTDELMEPKLRTWEESICYSPVSTATKEVQWH